MLTLSELEQRFLTIAGLDPTLDLSVFPLPKDSIDQVQTTKADSSSVSAVYTPLHLVDRIVSKWSPKDPYNANACHVLDLCAGYGQFTIRMLRMKERVSIGNDEENILANHYFSELQLSSCHKLIRIFSDTSNCSDIIPPNLFIGDSNYLNRIPKGAKGIYLYLEKKNCWVDINHAATALHNMREDQFIETIGAYQERYPGVLRFQLDPIRFDLVVSNPPYNRTRDLRLMKNLLGENDEQSIAKEFLVVHPSTWLLDLKNHLKATDSIYNWMRHRLDGNLSSVEFFNGNKLFNIGLFNCCIINHIQLLGYEQKCKVDFLGEKYTSDSIWNITKFGKDWNMVSVFLNKMESFVKKHGSIWDLNIYTQHLPEDKFYCQLSSIRGSVRFDDEKIMAGHDFYTFLQQDKEKNKGIRNTNIVKAGTKTPTFGFETEQERDNFLDYLSTDFARFCLALYKTGGNMGNGELSLVPKLDFEAYWDDEKLYRRFEIPYQMQEYIRGFLLK